MKEAGFDHEYRVGVVRGVRRSRQRAEEREVAADETTFRAPAAEDLGAVSDAAAVLCGHRTRERGAREIRERSARCRAVIRNQLATARHRAVQRGDVGVAEDDLGAATQCGVVDSFENAHHLER